jgi:hypothetical protein
MLVSRARGEPMRCVTCSPRRSWRRFTQLAITSSKASRADGSLGWAPAP